MLDRLAVLVPGFREDDPVDLTTTLDRGRWPTAPTSRATGSTGSAPRRSSTPRAAAPRSRGTPASSTTRRARAPSARIFVALALPRRRRRSPTASSCRRRTPRAAPAGRGLPTVVPRPTTPPGCAPRRTCRSCSRRWRRSGCGSGGRRIAVHTWSDEECCVPRGATGLTLVDDSVRAVPARSRAGDLLLLEEIASPDTGEAADADPTAPPRRPPDPRDPDAATSSSPALAAGRRGVGRRRRAAVRPRRLTPRAGTERAHRPGRLRSGARQRRPRRARRRASPRRRPGPAAREPRPP